MDKVKINHLPVFVVRNRPEYLGELTVSRPTLRERIIGRIQNLMECYIPIAVIWAVWIGLVIWGGEYIASK